MAKGKKNQKKEVEDSDLSVSDVSDISVSDVSDISVSDVSDVTVSDVSDDEPVKKTKKEKKEKKGKMEKKDSVKSTSEKESRSNSPRPKKSKKGDESSDDDTPLEDAEFSIKHQEWIDTVLKDEMSFTVSDPLQEGNRLRPYTTYKVLLMPLKVELRRRYSDFDSLRLLLLARYPAVLINPLPPKKAVNNTSDETVLLRMKSLEKWLNDIVRIPYIRMDTAFRAFISNSVMKWSDYPEMNTLSLHHVMLKSKKSKDINNEGFAKYQEFMTHCKCPEEVEAAVKAFKDQVEQLCVVMEKTTESVRTLIARQFAFAQSIDLMGNCMKDLSATVSGMDYTGMKVEDDLQEENRKIAEILGKTHVTCGEWFIVNNFLPTKGGRSLGDEMEGILLQTQGLKELFDRRWVYLNQYVEEWHKKDAALFEVHINKRKGNKAKVLKAQSALEEIERNVKHKKKYVTRFTKLILCGELQLYVKRQYTAVLKAFSHYGACSAVSYKEQMPIWEKYGKEIAENYDSLVAQYGEELDKMKQLEEMSDDVEEVDESEEEVKKVKVVNTKMSVESDESISEVSSSSDEEKAKKVDKKKSSDSDSDDLDDVSDSDSDL